MASFIPVQILFLSSLVAILLFGLPQSSLAQANRNTRPPVGEVTSLPDALLVYVGRDTPQPCAENCATWIAAEGTVHWDGAKRVIAALDRFASKKMQVVLNVRGPSDLRVAISIGRLLRERGFAAGVGQTIVNQCRTMSEAECVTLKRGGGPLHATVSALETCDIACVLILVGGVKRNMTENTTVVIQGTQVGHRLGLGIPEEIREGVHTRSSEQIKAYLTQMGIDTELADMIDANYGTTRKTVLSYADLIRMRIVTQP